jgi:hypothetical protein
MGKTESRLQIQFIEDIKTRSILRNRTVPNATLEMSLPKPTASTGVCRLEVVPSPTYRRTNVVSLIKSSAEYEQFHSSYLIFVVITPTADRPTLQNCTRMCLKKKMRKNARIAR